jgi:sugar (pentulose or hexulose) kinase
VTSASEPVLLGIDVGTSACKAAVVDLDGAERAHGQAATPWRRVPTGAEVDPEALFAAVVAAAAAALRDAPDGAAVAGVGVTSMAEAGVLLDDHNAVLHPAIAWYDARGAVEARRLEAELPDFAARTGLPAGPLATIAKLAHLGAVAGHARRWLNLGEWVVRRLGGEEIAELSLSSRTGLLDLEARAPWADALAWAGVRADLLPEARLAGTPAGHADGAALPAARGAVLTVAGHDHLVAGAGVGVVAPGDVLDSCGTAEALMRVVAPPLTREQVVRSVRGGVSVGWHVAADRQALLGSLWSGLALSEVLDALAGGERGREELDAGATRARAARRMGIATAPGEAPALELDFHALQRRAPVLPEAPAAHVWRAAVDAAAAEAERIIDHVDAVAGPHRSIVVTGGWSRDDALMAAKRELGAVAAPPVAEAGCRGAALLAGVAAGLLEDADHLPPVPIPVPVPVPEERPA